jgi:hypothetical protein
MKKSKLLVVGLIGLLMMGGLILVGCKEDELCPKISNGLGSCESSSIGSSGVPCGLDKCTPSKKWYSGEGRDSTDKCNC